VGLDLNTGDVLEGKYRIERKLGEGGMGVVFAATHLVLDQPVALKLLRAEVASHPDVAERFQREARAAAMIKSEHVARVLDVGALPSGEPFMVMEYLEGEDLERVLEGRGPLGPEAAALAVLEACHPLAEAHARGIVHRDLKPANLFLSRQPGGRTVLKVLDFGISKAQNDARKLTATSVIMGTPHYMSPEQIRSAGEVDARSDVWALGVILYELVSGALPFSGDNAPSIIAAISMDGARPLAEVAPEAPEGLARICEKCLFKDRSYRYADVGALARALLPFTRGESARELVSQIERVLGRSGEDPALGTAETVRPPSLVDAEERAARPGITAIAPSPELVVESPALDATPQALVVAETKAPVSHGVTAVPAPPPRGRLVLALGAVAVALGVALVGLMVRDAPTKGEAPSASATPPSASVPASADPLAKATVEAPPPPGSALPAPVAPPPASAAPSATVALVPPSPSPRGAPAHVPAPTKSVAAATSATPKPSATAPNIHTMSGLK